MISTNYLVVHAGHHVDAARHQRRSKRPTLREHRQCVGAVDLRLVLQHAAGAVGVERRDLLPPGDRRLAAQEGREAGGRRGPKRTLRLRFHVAQQRSEHVGPQRWAGCAEQLHHVGVLLVLLLDLLEPRRCRGGRALRGGRPTGGWAVHDQPRLVVCGVAGAATHHKHTVRRRGGRRGRRPAWLVGQPSVEVAVARKRHHDTQDTRHVRWWW